MLREAPHFPYLEPCLPGAAKGYYNKKESLYYGTPRCSNHHDHVILQGTVVADYTQHHLTTQKHPMQAPRNAVTLTE